MLRLRLVAARAGPRRRRELSKGVIGEQCWHELALPGGPGLPALLPGRQRPTDQITAQAAFHACFSSS